MRKFFIRQFQVFDFSVAFAAAHRNATLRLFDSGHELVDVLDRMWMETEQFCFRTPVEN